MSTQRVKVWILGKLPTSSQLSDAAFRARYRVVRFGLVLAATVVLIVGLFGDESPSHVAVEMFPILACIGLSRTRQVRTIGTAAVTLGLALSATVLVHFTNGLIESHFAFFVILPLIALLHEWRAIVGINVLAFAHHAVLGAIDPAQVYNHPAALENPALWSGVHVLFVASSVVVIVVHWNYSEAERRVTSRALETATRSQVELTEANARFRALVENSFDAIVMIDENDVISHVAGAFQKVFGWSPDDLLGRSAESLRQQIHRDDIHLVEDETMRSRGGSGIRIVEIRFRHPNGEWRWIELVIRPMRRDEVGGAVVNARDINETKLAHDLLAHRATHDELTELPNRTLLVERLDEQLRREPNGIAGAIFLDLDRFKNINDTLGHEVGDQLLVAVAQRLRDCIAPTDTVGRVGGDEFVILVDTGSDAASLRAVGQRVAAALAGPLAVGDFQLRASASIGVALGAPGDDAAVILRHADNAMYQAKQAGRNQVVVFDEAFRAQEDQRIVTESDLRSADLDKEMVLHYQPVIDTASGQLYGVEALIRWNHPTRGLLMPGEFIQVAEDTGLILRLGDWVLGEACRQAARWDQEYGVKIHMAVNVSARQLGQPGFARVVRHAIDDSGISPRRLLLEVTESALVDDPVMAESNLTDLRTLGVDAALDDYGTGYASLRYIRTLPLTHIKIDRSFTNGLGVSPEATTIVENTVSLAHGLGLVVVAEGVETAEQHRILQDVGCEFVQGYHLGRPMPTEALEVHPLFAQRLQQGPVHAAAG